MFISEIYRRHVARGPEDSVGLFGSDQKCGPRGYVAGGGLFE